MKTAQCQAIVLSTLNYGESDRIVSLFTLEHGRLRGFAKSARASRKRFGGLLEPTNHLQLQLQLKDEGLSRIERVESTGYLSSLREPLESLALALYACELVEMLTPEGHPLPRLYRLLSALIEYLAVQPARPEDRCFFEINLLNVLGYRPLLDDQRLQSLSRCLKTGTIGSITFSDAELLAARRLLEQEINSHCPCRLKSRMFLDECVK